MDPNTSFDYFLGQLIYGVSDDERRLLRASRPQPRRNHVRLLRLPRRRAVRRALQRHGPAALHQADLGGQDDYNLVNYTYFPTDGFVRDPSRIGTRAEPTPPPPPASTPAARTRPTPIRIAIACSWPRSTHRPARSSCRRTTAAGSSTRPAKGQADLNWTNPTGKYLNLRPRPADHLGLTYPMTANGTPDPSNLDVRNLRPPAGQ